MHLGDVLLTSSILLSGSNFQTVSMIKFMKFHLISKIQRTYLIQAVDEFWTEHQESVFDQLRGRDIIILGKYVC